MNDHNRGRRGVLRAILSTAATSMVGAPFSPAIAAVSTTVGTAGTTLQYLPLYVAAKRGLFEEQGLTVEIINTQSGPRTRQALAAGQVQFGFSAAADAPALSVAGKSAVIFFGIDHKMAWANLLVRTEDFQSGKIRTISDLSGLTVAVTQQKSAAWASMLELFANAQLKTAPNIQPLGDFGSIIAALKSKRVDAAALPVEMMNQAKADGWGTPIFTSADEVAWNRYMGGDVAGVAAYTLKKTVETQAALALKFTSALCKSTDFIFANSARTLADLVHHSYFDSFSQQLLESAIDFYQRTIYSRDNIVTPDQYARVIKIFGGDRLFAEGPDTAKALAYSAAVDMSFVRRSRGL